MSRRVFNFGLKKHPLSAWLVLLFSLLVTFWAWFVSDDAIKRSAQERFDFEAQDVAAAINNRMKEYELVLRSGRALFDASNDVTRADWSAFADTVHLQQYFPGIQALGYAVMLDPEQLPIYVQSVRDQGYPDFNVRPVKPREQYSSITYIEPFDWRNQRAFGYDMFSEPTRREAMEKARDTGEPAASGRVTLVQETADDAQYGFLMYYPVYHKQMPLNYVEERRAALSAYVYAAFRMGDLMHGILGQAQKDIGFKLFDGNDIDASNQLYSTDNDEAEAQSTEQAGTFGKATSLDVAGRTWTLYVYTNKAFMSFIEKHQPAFIVAAGLVLDLVLFYLISYLVRARIQAQYKAEQAVTDRDITEQRMQLAAEAGNMGLAEWNIADNSLFWDQRMLTLFGYSEKSFSGEISAWHQRLHPADAARVNQLIEHARKFSNHFEMRYRIILPDGKTRHLAANVLVERDHGDNALRMVGFHQDVTEQREAALALEEKHWRLQNVLEGTNVGTWEWNIATGATVFNQRWAEIIGYSLSELEPVSIDTWMQFLHPEDAVASKQALQSHFEGVTEFYTCEARMRHRDGHWVWVLDRGKVFSWDENGKPLLMFGTHQDITERKQFETLLTEERDKAELANRARGEFLANMSHEIRTPVNGVIGALTLLSDSGLTASQHNLVDISRRSADTLLGLINDILDLSKIEAGKLTIQFEEVNLLDIVNDVARSLASRAEAKGLNLLCPVHHMPPLRGVTDGVRLRQVLINLMSNAIKFTDSGQVTIDIDHHKTLSGSLKLRVNVRDTGSGIEKARQDNLFTRFEQLDNSLTRREGGTGLGLAISKQIIELMNGTIGVESEPGVGSNFWFELLLEQVSENDSETNSAFDGLSVCVVAADEPYRHFYDSLFSAWQISSTHVDSVTTVSHWLNNNGAQRSVILIDAETLLLAKENQALLANNPQVHVIATCPQAMLAVIPQAVSDHAELIISRPLIQSELYNALLTVNHEGQLATGTVVNEAAAPRQYNARVLVVEDNAINVVIICGLLDKFGIDSEVAEDGSQAISMLQQSDFDLVLMDCQMPVMDGYEATRQLRQDSNVRDADIPVIALTAHAMREDEQMCLAAGMNDYLTKPVDPYLLNEKLAKWLFQAYPSEA